MCKNEFLKQLEKALSGLPKDEIEERLNFYGEMIDDRIEEGLSEDEAVAAVGTVREIVAQTVSEIPLSKLAKERIRPKHRLRVWEIVLIAVGSPIWLSLLIAAGAVVLSLYVTVWSVVIAFWSVFGAFVGCALGGIAAGSVILCTESALTGLALIGAGLVLAGLSVFAYYGCKAATKGVLILTGKSAVWIKNRFIRKEET